MITQPRQIASGAVEPSIAPVMGYTPETELSSVGNFGLGLFSIAAEQNRIIPNYLRWRESLGFTPDPSYRMDDTEYKKASATIDEDLRLNLLEAQSREEFNYILHEATQTSLRRKILRDAGVGGSLATAGALATDPVSAAAMFAGPVASAGRVGIASYLSAGAANAAGSIATESLRAALSDDFTWRDAATSTVGDFFFGAGIARINAEGGGLVARAVTGATSQGIPAAFNESAKEDADVYNVTAAAGISAFFGSAFGVASAAQAAKRPSNPVDRAIQNTAEGWNKNRVEFIKNGVVPPPEKFDMDFLSAVSHMDRDQWNEMKAGVESASAPVVMSVPFAKKKPPTTRLYGSGRWWSLEPKEGATAIDIDTATLDKIGTRAYTGGKEWIVGIDAEGMKKRGGVVVDPTKPVATDSAASLVPPAQQQTVQSLPDITETLNSPDWVKQNVRNGRKLADSIGVTATIDDLASKRLTAQQIAIELKKSGKFDNMSLGDIKSEVVVPARTSMGIPSLEPKAEFEAWLNARNARLAQALPVSQAAAASPVPPSIPIREIVNYADWAKKMRELRLPSSKDDFRSWLGIITENRKTPVPYLDANGEQRIATSAFDITDDDVLQGEFSIPELKKSVATPDLSAAVRAGGTNQASEAIANPTNPLLRKDWKPGDFDVSRTSMSPASTTLKIRDWEVGVPIGKGKKVTIPVTLSQTAWASKDAIDTRGTWFANAIGTNFVPHADGVANQGVLSQAAFRTRARTADFNTALASHFKQHLDEAKRTGTKPQNQKVWMRQVTEATRNGGRLDNALPGVIEASKVFKKMLDEDAEFTLRHEGKSTGVVGAEENYVPRIPIRDALDQLALKHGDEKANRFWANAILSETKKNVDAFLPEEIAKNEKLAKRVGEQFQKNAGSRYGRPTLTGMAWEEFEELLTDTVGDLEADDLAHLKSLMFGKDEPKNPRMRSRVPMDENYSEVIDGITYRVSDFLENDPRRLYSRYTHEMNSHASMAELARVYKGVFGEDMPRTLGKFQQQVRKWYKPGAASAKRAETLWRQAAGYSTSGIENEMDQALMATAMALNNFVYVQVLGTPKAGVVQMSESLTHAVAPEISMGFAQKNFPTISEISELAKTGKLQDHELLAEALNAGYGRGLASRIPGGVAEIADGSYAGVAGKVADASDVYANFASKYVAFEGPVQVVQEPIAYVGAIGHWVDLANGTGNALTERRLKLVNLDKKYEAAIVKQIQKHGLRNADGKIVAPRTNEWDSPAVAAAYRQALRLATDRILNYGDASSMPGFAAKWYGKLFLHLRRYAIRATGNHLQTNLILADKHSALAVGASMVTGAIQYIVGTAMNATFRQDREEYLDEKLSTENIAKAMFARGSMMGMLPTVVDTGFALAGEKAPFAPYRLGVGGAMEYWTNFPALDGMRNFVGMFEGLRAPIESDYDFSQRNYDAFTKGTFLPQWMGALRAIREELDLPRESQSQEEQ